ncbi:MAG: isoleucine--tRNA ligase [Fidelibacterota bacterium]
MLDKVDPKVDFIRLEHDMLEFWEKNKIFQKRMSSNRGKKKWSFLDGPITANNPMGVHHAWGRTYKDIFQRYFAMKGFDQRYQNGFDCQGLWVEVEVEKELGFTSKTDIEEFGIENFVNACKERVRRFSRVQTDQSIRLGYWMDWDNSYYTMSDENNYTIWHFLKVCHQKGWIYKGEDVMPWCIDCSAALSEHEIATEGYAQRTHPAVTLRFPLKESPGESLLVWTTTPWTLTSNVAAAVHPDMEYVKVKQGEHVLYLVATRTAVLEDQGSYEVLSTLKGSDLVGRRYEGPFDEFEAQRGVDHPVVAWDEVNDAEGTGVVHMAPGCGHEDFQLAKEMDLNVLAPLDEFGDFVEGYRWLTGRNVRDVARDLIRALEKKNILYREESYTHRYPICWRHKTDVVFRLVDEWFISMDGFRNEIMNVVRDIQWIPEWGLDRELDWLKNMEDWMISKKRYWGLALPIYECDRCGSVSVIGGYDELKARAVEGWKEFVEGEDGKGYSPHRPWIDRVRIRCETCEAVVSRIPDVGNPWLDAGIVPYSTLHYLGDRAYWEEWFPADFITENLAGQFRNWFYSLLAMSTALENRAPFKIVLGHALVKDEQGRDMHKSAGNAIWFDEAAERMGVDVMRWIFASQNPEHNLLFGYGPAREIRKKLITLWNVYSFFVTYAGLDRFDPHAVELEDRDLTKLDLWILSKMNQLILRADSAYQSFRVDWFMRQVDRFLRDLSNWYVRRSRRRFWKSENDRDKNAAYMTLYTVLTDLIKILAPVVPFMTERIYQNLVRNLDASSLESVHLTDFPEASRARVNEDLIEEIDAVVTLVEMGRHARNQANLKIRQPLAKLQFATENARVAEAIGKNQEQIKEELNVKEVQQVGSEKDLVSFRLEPNLPLLGKRFGKEVEAVRNLIENTPYDDVADALEGDAPIRLTDDEKHYDLAPEDIVVKTLPVDGKSAVRRQADQLTVAVTTDLSEELIQEGRVRDMIRQVQTLRKEANFNVEDRISVTCKTTDSMTSALLAFKEYFCAEVLAAELKTGEVSGDYNKDFSVQGESVSVGISRISNH